MASAKEKHWGEFEDNTDDTWEDHSLSSNDIEELLIPHLYPPTSAAVHQPSPQLTSSFQILSGESCRSDVTVQNTIRLLQHTRHVSSLINKAQSIAGGNSNSNGGAETPHTLQSCPQMPLEITLPRTPIGYQPLNFLPPQATPFTLGREGGLNLEVEHNTARKMLRQAVALVCAHTGFTETTDSVLRTLTDLTHEFMSKLTKLYRTNMDTAKLNNNYCGFHDVLEQTMQEAGIGGLLDLHKMYKERVQNYYSNVKINAIQLTHHYNLLVNKQQQLLQQQQQQQQQNITLHQFQQSNQRRDSSSALTTAANNSDWWQQQTSSGNSTTAVKTASNNKQQLSSSSSTSSSTTPYTNIIPTAGGGSINITIGGVPAMNFPNMTVGTEDTLARVTQSTVTGARNSSSAVQARTVRTSSNSSSDHELLKHFTPSNIQ